jgi:hypothetical protein
MTNKPFAIRPFLKPAVPLLFGAMFVFAGMELARANYYAGSGRCRTCHATRYREVTNSIHAKMIRVNAHLPGVIHGDLRRPNAPTTNDVHWVMGGWYKEESYIRTNWTGSNWTYTVTQFQWDPIKGTYVNNQPLRDWTVKCAGCHTTGYDPAARSWKELNIGCEACHGPGGDHADDGGDTIFPVVDGSAEGCGHCHIRAESVAMGGFTNRQFNFPIGYVPGQPNTLQFIPEPLTATGSFFPDGTANRHRQQYLDMNYPGRTPTKHYQQGVTCTKCHNPHTAGTLTTYASGFPAGVYGVPIYDNVNSTTNYVAWERGANLWHPTTHTAISKEDLCKTCHAGVSDHHVHQFNAAALAASVTCVDCHMPDVINVDATTLRGALTPHRFTAMMPANSIKFGPNSQPNSCTYRCHQNQGADKTARALWADSIISPRVIPLVASSHPFQVRIVGTPDYQYVLQGSSDLVNWENLTTNTAAPLLNAAPRWGFEFTDPASTTSPSRFYRSKQIYPAP